MVSLALRQRRGRFSEFPLCFYFWISATAAGGPAPVPNTLPGSTWFRWRFISGGAVSAYFRQDCTSGFRRQQQYGHCLGIPSTQPAWGYGAPPLPAPAFTVHQLDISCLCLSVGIRYLAWTLFRRLGNWRQQANDPLFPIVEGSCYCSVCSSRNLLSAQDVRLF